MTFTVGGLLPSPCLLSQGRHSPTEAGPSSSSLSILCHSRPLTICLNRVLCPMLLQTFAWLDHSQEVGGS